VKALVEEAVSFCQDRIQKSQAQVKIQIDSQLVLECRAIQMSQVLVNLIQNSCDAIQQQPEKWIRIEARTSKNFLVLTVTDSGAPIPAEVQKKLMQPFFTTKEVGKGTGLGLSISKGIIGSHMGRFWLNSSAPHTTFVVEVPLHQRSQNQAA
jgi:C4-dicarboxylate-specific signal transduction histidine kinase